MKPAMKTIRKLALSLIWATAFSIIIGALGLHYVATQNIDLIEQNVGPFWRSLLHAEAAVFVVLTALCYRYTVASE